MNESLAERDFQLWEFKVSLGSMLIRSPKTVDFRENIDLVYMGVEYVDLPKILRGVEISEPTMDEVEFLRERLGRDIPLSRARVLVSQGRRFHIVSSHFNISVNENEIFESPFSWFGTRNAGV